MNPEQALLRHARDALRDLPVWVPVLASPIAAALGARIARVGAATHRVEVDFEPGPEFVQGAGVVLGGALAALLDLTLGYAALASLADGLTVATATLNVSFLGTAHAGVLRATGEVERTDRRMVFAAARVCDAEGRLVATASSALAVSEWRAPSP
jgi:uncharacterized protein (TIGR00369 family)